MIRFSTQAPSVRLLFLALSVGFAVGLIVAILYFLFIIIADTMRANAKIHPELLVWFPNVLFIFLGFILFRRLSKQ